MATSEIGELQVLITAQADKFNAEIAKVQNQIQAMSASTGKLSAKTIAMGSILGNVATKAFGKLVSVVRESDLAYRSASQSLTKLATIMQQRGATQAQYNEIVKLTEAEEKLGVISNDAMQNGLQELATYVGKAESLKKLTNVMNNLVVQQHGYDASSYNVLQTATMMGKVLQGQTGGMERIGYHLTEDEKALFNFGTEEERVALLTDIVNNNLGDLNHRLGETNVGRQIQLANTWAQLRAQIGELASAVGNILIPVFSAIANVVGRAIAYIKAFLGLFGIKTANAASQTASNVSNAADAVGDYGDAAEGAAKKAKKALAAFDEMNVLTEDTSSGSSGGGGGGGVDILEDLEASAQQIDWGSLIPDIELPKWVDKIKNLFKEIDFSKLQKSMQKYWESLKTYIKNVLQIGEQFIEKFIQPVAKFAIENALPRIFDTASSIMNSIDFDKLGTAFSHLFSSLARVGQFLLDAFAGLYEILGPIITWINNFVVPPALEVIAFTINVISSVLQGIWNAVVNLYNAAVKPLLDALAACFEPILNFLNDVFGGINDNSNAWSGLTSIVQTVVEILTGPLKVAFEAIAWVINNIVKPAIDFVVGAFQFCFGWLFNLLGITNDNTEAAKNNKKELSELEKQYDKNGDGALNLGERLEYLEQCMNNENKAEKDLIMAQKSLAERMTKLDEYVQKYNKTADELIQMHREGKLSELAQGEALNDLTLAVIDLESANYNVKEATEKYNQEQGETQSQANQLKEQYDMLGETLVKVAENGEQGSLIWNDLIKQMDNLAKKIQSTGKNVGEMRDWYNEAVEAGKNVAQGAANGVDQNSWKYTNSMIRMGQNGLDAFKQFNVIKSPSKLMRKMGGYVGEGAALGVMDTYGDYREAMEGLAEIGENAFNADLSTDNINKTAVASVSAMLELDSLGKTIAENISVNNTVNIGSETFYQDIVDNINEQSHLANRCVLNI